jgi:hypothetical protein
VLISVDLIILST